MFKRKMETTVEIAKWEYSGNTCRIWRGDFGNGALYFTICVDKNNSLPSDEVINLFICNLFNGSVRNFDEEYFDKGMYWTKTFSFWVK
ncbi:hypothetical protein [Enterococcus sp. AZ136]|uniref:hypothetical protein n=1 Tax=Enterococcus sp. AZ136 TaxID=2774788 RepID=UPI003D2E01FB